MNCTYCFNNNIPNHYQTGNSLSTECKSLCFHYDLLLKKTIFKSSILSYLPNNPGPLQKGASSVCKITYAALFHHKWIDMFTYLCQLLYYLLIIIVILLCIQFDMPRFIQMALHNFGYLDNLEKNHSHTNVKH